MFCLEEKQKTLRVRDRILSSVTRFWSNARVVASFEVSSVLEVFHHLQNFFATFRLGNQQLWTKCTQLDLSSAQQFSKLQSVATGGRTHACQRACVFFQHCTSRTAFHMNILLTFFDDASASTHKKTLSYNYCKTEISSTKGHSNIFM